ncbi:hypothetical protein RBB79_16550 [Tunturiibacter empetritectus]|uniref:Glycosyltransferase RgtA/B/C/D-like domain-containing protein n=2 Tax=Tunturiibacter TaxID=3154218 RepID=A0A852VJ72_9BACT|nr:hypothetical protein [Edaphobacter lichenicola]NYF91231.1 hypothetical protein [Edaphobacter lichenicola]
MDDGYFYPQIARYIARGQGSTFNGIMLTNGYHPLWMLICVIGAWITPASYPLVQLLTSVQDVLILGCVYTIVSVSRRAKMRGSVLGCLPLLFFGMVLGIWRLLEANLALALQLSVLIIVCPVLSASFYDKLGRWRNLLIGTLFGLTMLARLDLMFFVATILIYEIVNTNWSLSLQTRTRSSLIQMTAAGMLLAPYFIWNIHQFGHLLPISGAIKSTFPHPERWGFSNFMYPVIGAIFLNSSLLIKKTRTSFENICILTAIAAALHMAYTLTFGELAPWYLTTGYLTLCFCVIWMVDSVLRVAPSLEWMETALAALVFFAFLSLAALRIFSNFTYTHFVHRQVTFHGSYLEPKLGLAITLRDTLPKGSRIFVFDAPGSVAFYSGMSILPVDGLVANYAYNDEVVKEGFSDYATRKHIDYFIAPYLHQGQIYDRLALRGSGGKAKQIMEIKAPLTKRDAGTVILSDANLIFRYREITTDLETVYPEVGIWRIPH